MKIYTKTGDGGETSLYGGKRIPKSDSRLEAYGTLDELNAVLGLADSWLDNKEQKLKQILQNLQANIFTVGTELATPDNAKPTNFIFIDDGKVAYLETQIDTMSESLPSLTNFILPGGSQLAASLHLARTIARRAERSVVKLSHSVPVRPLIIIYLNRLSDYLFVLARFVNQQAGQTETKWLGRG